MCKNIALEVIKMAAIIIAIVVFFVAPIVAMWFHSKSTVLHSIGVANTAIKFARVLGYGRIKTANIALNAVFHDIGKLGISGKILHKAGKLDDEERAKINGHCSNIFARVYGFFFPAAIGHHKNFVSDGYGAEKIQSNVSAFIEICDVYDAVCGYFRSYAQPRTKEQVIDIMNAEQHKFDPELFDAFMENIDEFKVSPVAVKLDAAMRH